MRAPGQPGNAMHQNAMKALYLDDTITTCECCGRTGLKATMAMQLDCGGIMHYGRTCAARNSGKTSQQVTKELRVSQQLAHGQATNALMDLRRTGTKITRELIREVAALFRADATLLIQQWV